MALRVERSLASPHGIRLAHWSGACEALDPGMSLPPTGEYGSVSARPEVRDETLGEVVVIPAGDDPRICEPRGGLEVMVDVTVGEAADAQAHGQGQLTV